VSSDEAAFTVGNRIQKVGSAVVLLEVGMDMGRRG